MTIEELVAALTTLADSAKHCDAPPERKHVIIQILNSTIHALNEPLD